MIDPARSMDDEAKQGSATAGRRRVAGLVIGSLMIAAGMSACSGSAGSIDAGPERGGPIILGGAEGTSCISSANGNKDLAYGFEGIGNSSSDPITIDDVELVGPENLTLVSAYLVPTGLVLVGNHSSWPPARDVIEEIPSVRWAERTGAEGSVIEGNSSGMRRMPNLVLHLRRTAMQGGASFKHVAVTYTVDDEQFRSESTISFVSQPRC